MNEYTEIKELRGVGDKTASLLHKLGIYTIWDLLTYYPRDYETVSGVSTVSECETYIRRDEKITLRLKICSQGKLTRMKYQVLTFLAKDDTGVIELKWFNMAYLKKSLKEGSTYVFRGSLKRKGASYILSQPKIFKEEDFQKINESIQPVYSLTKGITSQMITKLVHQALTEVHKYKDYLEKEISNEGFLKNESFMELNDAIKTMHFPSSMEAVYDARRRLVFDEFLFFLMNVRILKDDNHRELNSCKMFEVAETGRILERLPYSLTNAQIKCFKEILEDLSGEYSMNRLIQGDVGSGKTIVATLALITCAVNGYQGAMMAPTEVLARQHAEGIRLLLQENHMEHIKVILLSGSMTAKEKREAKALIENGEANIVIGTHALIQDDVIFKRLGLVITDEQHRFGVKQRNRLVNGNYADEIKPHVLVMSATPIPRTLAIIIYGDLDISVIDELPASRLPIKNCVVGPNYRPKAYQFIEKQVRGGRQALVVCPKVEDNEETENSDIENVVDYSKKIKQHLPADFVVEYLHGKMKPKDKTEIMERFASGEIDVLISTTVIEVGINVPNTTVMMVENSERFGLAQLHQLRGRVGRGEHQSYCIFMCNSNNENTLKKLDILNKSNDGFKIAEEDLKQRGPGDMFGFRQSGDMAFKIGDIYTDAKTLKLASDFADYLMDNFSDSNNSDNQYLYERLSLYSRNQLEKVNL